MADPTKKSQTAEISDHALDYANGLISRYQPKEFSVQADLMNLLRALDFEPRPATTTASGEADIFLPQHKTVIETKQRGQVNPDAPGSKVGETQAQQVARYVRDLAEYGQVRLGEGDRSDDVSWKGILTDGLLYYLYRFDAEDGQPRAADVAEIRDFTVATGLDLCEWLVRRLGDVADKRPLPESAEELADIFKRHLPNLGTLHQDLGRLKATATKQSLWLDMNRGSGFEVNENKDALFRNHTLLVTGAEAVIASLRGNDAPGIEIITDGFATWPQNRGIGGAPTSTDGADWTNAVFDSVREFDWRSRGRDVLRDVYESLIDRPHRKAFGEYYTPDWLSAAVVHEVLDDGWCERAIDAARSNLGSGEPLKGVGVLDPACGSGTFLYQAARRLLESEAMRRQYLPPHEQAQVVLDLVVGIDIHPIAVSIAEATLLRALPSEAHFDSLRVNVYQADSLAIERSGGIDEVKQDGQIVQLEAKSPDGTPIPMPIRLAERPDLGPTIKRIVESAHGNDPLPRDISSGLSSRDAELLQDMHQTLRNVIQKEGNSVWAWWIYNWLAAWALRRRGIDRIVANPPWVVMNNIQVEDRRGEIERIVGELGLSAGGETATAFDIAGLFVRRCRDLYLRGNDTAAGWVLPWGALKAESWKRVRADQKRHTVATWDLAEVKVAPFSGSKSCVWVQRAKMGGGERTCPVPLVVRNRSKDRLGRSDDYASMLKKLQWVPRPKEFHQAASDYSDRFRNGATLFPHCLVLVESVVESDKPNQVRVALGTSRHRPWSGVRQVVGEVLASRVLEAVYAPRDLLTFGLHVNRSRVLLVPEDPSGEKDQQFLEFLNEKYKEHSSESALGGGTPKTLRGNVDFNSKLSKQFESPKRKGRTKVVYNSSGQILRAVRIPDDVIVDHACFYGLAVSEDEAGYLISLLNAPALQLAYQQSRTSDRHFNLNPVKKVPIPAFDPSIDLHRDIAKLCPDAEAAAELVLEILPAGTSRIKASSEIRRVLRETGVADAIDDAVRQLMPEHTVQKYDASTPHPWK